MPKGFGYPKQKHGRTCLILMLAGEGDSTVIVYNALKKTFQDVEILLEDPVPASQLVRRRVKKLGYITVFGQILFQVLVVPALKRKSKTRIDQIIQDNNLDLTPIPQFTKIDSVNSETARQIIKDQAPRVVVVNGTRIISKGTLAIVSCPIINTHAGITPLYRGVHGAYWALAEKKPELCGVTVHYLNAGIDTGEVIAQAIITPSPRDNFRTYPYLQLAAGVPLLMDAVRELLAGNRPHSLPITTQSKLRSHPTIWQYWRNRV